MARPVKNHAGERIGRLTLVELAPKSAGGIAWVCACDCGTLAVVKAHNLQRGATKSCGCLRREIAAPLRRKPLHGMTGTRTFLSWVAMNSRCSNPNATHYQYYGGRGIAVCDRWRGDFQAFLADMGERPEGRTLDRIDVDGNYEPSNCRWATPVEQAANKRPRPEERRFTRLDRAPVDDHPDLFEGHQ